MLGKKEHKVPLGFRPFQHEIIRMYFLTHGYNIKGQQIINSFDTFQR